MTAVAYAMRDHAPASDGSGGGSISISKALGGCGDTHQAQVDDRGRVFYECDLCAPAAVGGCYGFSASPAGVPLTPDEVGDRELAKRDAEAAQSVILSSMTDAFVRNLAAGAPLVAPPPAKSLAEQVAGMSEGEKAELAKLLGAEAAKPDEEGHPAKATGGRARKTA